MILLAQWGRGQQTSVRAESRTTMCLACLELLYDTRHLWGAQLTLTAGFIWSQARSGPPRVTEMHGFWTAIIDLAGEAYQAFFKNKESALESFNAATQHIAA